MVCKIQELLGKNVQYSKVFPKTGFAVAQATSAQSERDFSQTGLIRTARRAETSAKKLTDVEVLDSVVKNLGF